jgi:general secretion pathway protein F
MTTAITLDELTALSDEIGALVRAGVPLEQGLADLGGDLPGRLGRLAAVLSQRTSRGEPLAEVVADQLADFPPAYQAVIKAGLKAHRLPAALEAVAGAARRLAETQRAVAVAAAYPLLVFVVVWVALACLTGMLAPRLAASFSAFDSRLGNFFGFLSWLGRGSMCWGPAVPLALLLLAGGWWYASRRARILHAGRASWLSAWVPWFGRMLRWSRTATFLEIFALLVENQAPLDEAVLLAAEASGDLDTIRDARQLAAELRQGGPGVPQPGQPCSWRPRSLPPLIHWLMLAAARDGALLQGLKSAAETYRRRTVQQSEVIRMFLPVLLTLTVSGGVTLVYALIVFGPYTALLNFLARSF